MLTAGRRITRLAAAVTILGLGSNACTGETTGSSEANFSDRYLASLIGVADSHENEEVMTDYLRYEEASISHCMDEAGFDYVAAPPESIFVPFGYTGDPLTDAKKFGFGISTVDVNVQASATNPNDAILASARHAGVFGVERPVPAVRRRRHAGGDRSARSRNGSDDRVGRDRGCTQRPRRSQSSGNVAHVHA